MAINFLNTIDLNKNSLDNARIQNLASDPNAGDSSVGQIYYNTTAQALKIYKEILPATNPKTYEWVEVGSDSVEAGVGIGVTFTGGNVIVRNTGLVSVLDGTYINLTKQGGGDDTQLTADLNAVDGTAELTTRFLSKDNTWDVPVFDDYSSWSLEGDSGTAEAVSSGETVDIAGGLKITTDIAANRTLNIVHDLQAQTDGTSAESPTYGGTFTTVDTVTRDTTGHVTGINVKTITLPASDDTTYDLTSKANASSGADIDLTGSDATVDTVTLIGTAGEIEVAQSSTAGTIVISQPSDVTIGNDLQVDGDANINGALTVVGQVTVPAATASTSAPNLGQVEQLVAGIGLFKGGYDASTDPGSPVISGSANIALDLGDYFVVTVDGDITFSDTTISVEVGDMIFANAAIAVNTDPASTSYTFVIQDANIAGSGADDASTEKGVAGFDSASFDVSAAGWVQLKPQANPYGAKQDLNNTAPCTRAEAGGLTTFTIDLTDTSLFGTSALAANVKAEITQIASPYETVYADVARSGTGTISFAFTGSVASDVYAALLVYV
jgi:hypothetical protein